MPNGFKPEFITRHRDLISDEALGRKIVVVGAGAIGSFVVLSLAKMGFSNIHVYDFDTVEPENIGAQFYPIESIGKKKVDALQEMVWRFTGVMIWGHNEAVDEKTKLNAHVVISAVDNMSVREMIFDIADAYHLIDPRMGAEYATMHTVLVQDKASREEYAKSLFTDGEAVQERCTAKTTIYTVLLISGQVVKAVKDVLMGRPPIESLDWSIRDNAMLAFGQGRRL